MVEQAGAVLRGVFEQRCIVRRLVVEPNGRRDGVVGNPLGPKPAVSQQILDFDHSQNYLFDRPLQVDDFFRVQLQPPERIGKANDIKNIAGRIGVGLALHYIHPKAGQDPRKGGEQSGFVMRQDGDGIGSGLVPKVDGYTVSPARFG